MMNLKKLRQWMVIVILASVITGCTDDPERIVNPGEEGFFIVNEGAFNNNNASLSFYDRNSGEVDNYIFEATNARGLGDQAQSMSIHEGIGYIVVQNDQKIEVIDTDTYESITTISEGIPSPRHFLGISADKGYVSDWGADGLTGSVKVIDLETFEVIKTIFTGAGADRMLLTGNLVYVTNSGGFGVDNSITVINATTDEVVETIIVGDNPNSIVQDASGNFWVTASGATAYNADYSIDESNSTLGTLSRINSANQEELQLEVDTYTFSGIGDLIVSPEGDIIYFTYNGGLYRMAVSATELPASPFVDKSYYGIAVDPTNGNIIGAVAPNFSSAGYIEIMNADGTLLDTHETGIAPNGCVFK